MFTRTLGGLAACVGLAASAAAQQPSLRPQMPVAPVAYKQPVPTAMPPQAGPLPGTATPAPIAGSVATPAVPPAAPTAPTVPPVGLQYPAYEPGSFAHESVFPDSACGPAGQFWITAEWMRWRTSGHNIPPLVTNAPVGTAQGTAGVLGVGSTTVLFGGSEMNDDWRNGFRYGMGLWLDQSQTLGFEADFLYLGQSRERIAIATDGSTILARPFTNALTGAPDAQLVSFPGVVSGTVLAEVTSNVAGGGATLIRNVACDPCGRFDLTLGFRYLGIRDEVMIRQGLTTLAGGAIPAGTAIDVTDRFRTGNHFYGLPIGFNWERRWSHWYLDLRGSVALGWTHTSSRVDGGTTVVSGTPTAYPNGLLAQPTNIGDFTENKFAVMPEIGVRLGAQVTDRTRAFVGYNFLYLTSVTRAGDTIDLRVNPNQIAPPQALGGPGLPVFQSKTSDFWMTGFSLGIEYRF